jgi:hypothetical protein
MYCWKCGTENPSQAIFCNKCGTKVRELPNDEINQSLGGGTTPHELTSHKLENTEATSTYSNTTKVGPSGVGGWLSYFCFSLTVLVPLRMIGEFASTVAEDPDTASIVVILLLSLGLAAYSITTGIRIWRSKDDAIKQAKIFLIVSLVLNILSAIIVGSQSYSGESATLIFITGVGSFVIWYIYLSKSVRVRNTFRETRLLRR